MLTLTSKYAMRAMIYVTRHSAECPVSGRRISEQTGIPRKYLSKVLGDLTRIGMLKSSPGRRGGFCMTRPAAETRLCDVLAPFEPRTQSQCPFDNETCGRLMPCAAHHEWEKILAAKQRFLERTTLQDVAADVPIARRRRVPRQGS